jgi:hypothetical protein
MSRPVTRAGAIAAKCRDCIHDAMAAGTWLQQVAACPVTVCSLWRFRPVPRGAPDWLASRLAERLPAGWAAMGHEATIALLREGTDSGHSARVGLQNGASAGWAGSNCLPAADGALCGSSGAIGETAV